MSERRDLFELTEPSRFSVLRRRTIHVVGATSTLEDPDAIAREHPDVATINEAAYAATIINFRVGAALELANKGIRTPDEEAELKRLVKKFRVVAKKLRPLYRHLAPPDSWSPDARPATLVDHWMKVLPQIESAVEEARKKARTDEVDAGLVREVLESMELLPFGRNVPMYRTTASDLLQLHVVLTNSGALKVIARFCNGRPRLQPRDAAFAIVGRITGKSPATVRKARDHYRKTHPKKVIAT